MVGESGSSSESGGEKKTFVLDTNVLIHDPEALFSFEENEVVLPIMVIEELDNLKSGVGSVPFSSRKALRNIGSFLEKGDISAGIRLPGGGSLRVETSRENFFLETNSDNLIISCAIALKKAGAPNVVVVSKDTGVRIKTEAMGVSAQDYKRDKTTLFQKYGRVLDGEDYGNGILSVRYQKHSSGIVRLRGKEGSSEIRNSRDLFGISPKNPEQICAMDALTNLDVRVVALTGRAGTGKTLLALAAALCQTTKAEPLFDKIIIARPTIPMDGYDLGFLPGDLSEKIDPWMKPIYDNLEFLVKTSKDTSGGKNIKKPYESFRYFLDADILEIESLTYIRGRSLPKMYVIIDEAQNCRPLDAKTLVTRLGEGSKIVFTGDLDQIDTPYLDAESNGLAYLIARAINQEDFCYLSLQKSERSEVANRYAKIL